MTIFLKYKYDHVTKTTVIRAKLGLPPPPMDLDPYAYVHNIHGVPMPIRQIVVEMYGMIVLHYDHVQRIMTHGQIVR